MKLKEVFQILVREAKVNTTKNESDRLLVDKFSHMNITLTHSLPPQLVPEGYDRGQSEFRDILEFFLKRKKKTRIPTRIKRGVVLDAKTNKLTIQDICRKYFLNYSTAKSIFNEVTDYQAFSDKGHELYQKCEIFRVDVRREIQKFIKKNKG